MPYISYIQERLKAIKKRKSLIPSRKFLVVLDQVNRVLEHEDTEYRPHDSKGMPGGLIYLDPDVRTILIPDLHARLDFLYTFMTGQRCKHLSLLAEKKLQVVCLGDGLHSERSIPRWIAAYDEYINGYKLHHHMDLEMIQGLGTMEMIMYLKCQFPDYFHYLKGNHDNIADETKNGNYSFHKYAAEGAMVTKYMTEIVGKECFNEYYRFEKNLPLLAVGRRFLASHAEPVRFFNEESVIEYRRRPEVIQGLTWTDNNRADTGSVSQMIRYYIDEKYQKKAFYFGGHRPVQGNYFTRARGKYVQFHNPRQYNIVVIEPEGPIDLEKAVTSIGPLFPFLL